jgi:hypothetical protein
MYAELLDRQGQPIKSCGHSWHYDAVDHLPICHDGREGRRCEGYTVQCGQGYAPCERHADRREETFYDDVRVAEHRAAQAAEDAPADVIVTLEADTLDSFLRLVEKAHVDGCYRLRVAVDGGSLKLKVNEGMWTPGLGRVTRR